MVGVIYLWRHIKKKAFTETQMVFDRTGCYYVDCPQSDGKTLDNMAGGEENCSRK